MARGRFFFKALLPGWPGKNNKKWRKERRKVPLGRKRRRRRSKRKEKGRLHALDGLPTDFCWLDLSLEERLD